MASIFSFATRRKKTVVTSTVSESGNSDTVPRPNNLKPMSNVQLLDHLSLSPMISDIRRLVPVSDGYWDQLYYQAYLNVAEIMQCLPASQNHHHAGPGGLLIHTTETIRHAMRIIKNYQLPKGVGPEERTTREHRWRYGVFIAALLHDVGKTLAMCQITIHYKNGEQKPWTPYIGQMPKDTHYYSIQFPRSKFYKLQQHLSVTLFNLIPATARDWLMHDLQLMSEIVAYLNGDPYECGVIGEIVRLADMESTSRNLRLGGHSIRFPTATKLPLIDRLMTSLRHLLNDGTLKINQKGSTGWTKDGKIYLVCRTVANAVQQYLSEQGATDIPQDVTRLYDTWQEHGFALSNDNGGSIWKVSIGDDDYHHNLTVLIFDTDRLFKVGHSPKDFNGKIEILGQDEKNCASEPEQAVNKKEAETEQEIVIPKKSHDPVTIKNKDKTATEHKHTDTAPENNSSNTSIENQPAQIKDDKKNNSESVTIGTTTLPGFIPDSNNDNDNSISATDGNIIFSDSVNDNEIKKPETDYSNDSVKPNTGADSIKKQETGEVDELIIAIGEAPEPNSREVAEHFFEWIRYRLRTNQLYVNRPNARMHRIKQGVALVSPAILQDFCKSMNYPQMTNDKETWKVVQNHLHKVNKHIKHKRQNLQKIIIKSDKSQNTLNVYLFDTDFFYQDIKAPDINSKVTLIEV